MFDTVLVAADDSASAAAVDRAVDVAATDGATLHAIYVVNTASPGPADVRSVVPESLDEEGGPVLEELRNAAEAAGVGVRGTVEHGSPTGRIVAHAEDVGAALAVVGTRGRRDVGRVLPGSVAERVTRTTSASVPVARPDEAGDEPPTPVGGAASAEPMGNGDGEP